MKNIKFSKNVKLNNFYEAIYTDMLENLGVEEIKRYKGEFPYETDCNIAQYGNLLCYYTDVRELMKICGYKEKNYTDEQVWNFYKGVVGTIARNYIK